MADRIIEAAGGLLWRASGDGIEVAIVHRPKYDDWSLPKGKLVSGEHPVLGGLREVAEETGYIGIPGRYLGEIHYLKDGAPKRVRYWAMRVAADGAETTAEVDEVRWLPPAEAQRLLLPDRDRWLLDDIDHRALATWPCILVRHGSAGDRAGWQGDDRERPLDELGEAQAEAVVPLLAAYQIERVLSADVVRCLETIMPFASAQRLTVENEPLLSETGYADHPRFALERLLAILATGRSTLVCSQGKVLPGLIAGVTERLRGGPAEEMNVRKGGVVVLHLRAGEAGPELVQVERLDPPGA